MLFETWSRKVLGERRQLQRKRSREQFWDNSSSSKIHKPLRDKRDGELMRVKN